MQKIFVKPAPGKRCKDPKTGQLLPEKGRYVPRSGYWIRRLIDGDCYESSPVKEVQPISTHSVEDDE